MIYSSKFESGCCGSVSKDTRVLDKRMYSFAAKDLEAVIDLRESIMTKFSHHLSKNGATGILEKNKASYTPGLMAWPWNKRILAIISPKSGKGKAQKFFMEIEPALKANGFIIETILTEKKAHATDILKDMSPEKFKTYYCILIFGGDGVVTEAINGFYQKGSEVIKEHNLILRVASFIGGTENALARYSTEQHGLCRSLWNLVYVLTRQKFEDLSVFNWEIASDVDNYKSSQNIRAWHS